MAGTTNPYVTFRNSEIHGKGGFAKTHIPEGTRIIEYVGEKITKAETDRRTEIVYERHEKNPNEEGAVYIFTLNQRYDIDGDVEYNKARLLNHSCDPNCETDIIQGKIWIIATRDIEKGEEVVYNYGFDYDSYEDHPCRCGSDRCVGFILDEDEWPRLKRKQKREAEKKLKKAADLIKAKARKAKRDAAKKAPTKKTKKKRSLARA